jgi:cyclase
VLAKRLIACLDVRDGQVVKGVHFAGLRGAGDPAALAGRYRSAGIDELVMLDITATVDARAARAATIRDVSRVLDIPLTVGGGMRSLADAETAFGAGADKVSINTAALLEPGLISAIASRFGSQAVVIAIDTRREGGEYRVFGRSATARDRRDPVGWAREAADRGAGEILLTSIDRDGTKLGYDCNITAAVAAAVGIPVIASGGAGSADHVAEVLTTGGADAALAASIFHFNDSSVAAVKRHLAARGIAVRPVPEHAC